MTSKSRQSHFGSFFACLTMDDEETAGWGNQQGEKRPLSPGRVQRLQQRSSTLLINPPLEGFLLKKGAKGITLGWKRRWFVLANQRLYYYKSSDAARNSQLGFIDLRGSYEIEEGNDIERCHFRIRTPDRIWYLAADAEEECRFWLEGLRSFKKRQQRFSHNNDTIARLRSESEMRLARDGDIISPEEEVLELKRLLEEAELELEDKSRHVDELYHDLQNSIQIIRLKNNQVDMLNQRLEDKSNECQRINTLLHGLSSPMDLTSSPTDHHVAVSPPSSPLWARNSWQGGSPSGFPHWRYSQRYSISAEHRVEPHSLPESSQYPSDPAPLQPSDIAPSPTVQKDDADMVPVSTKLLYEIRQGEGLLSDQTRIEQKVDALSPQLSTEQFLDHLVQSMNSFAAFVEGTDNASHEAITYWAEQIKQHVERTNLQVTNDVQQF